MSSVPSLKAGFMHPRHQKPPLEKPCAPCILSLYHRVHITLVRLRYKTLAVFGQRKFGQFWEKIADILIKFSHKESVVKFRITFRTFG